MQLGLDGARNLGREHFDIAAVERGQQGDREEDDTQTSYPLGERAPEEETMGQRLDIVYHGGAGGGEARHVLKERVGEVVDIPAQHERQRAEKAEDHPRQRDDHVGVLAREAVARLESEIPEDDGGKEYQSHRGDKRRRVALAAIDRDAQAQRHEGCLDEEERSHDLAYHVPVDHSGCTLSDEELLYLLIKTEKCYTEKN